MLLCVRFLTVFLWLWSAEAVVLPDLYQINVPVASEEEARLEKNTLLKRSFETLLFKMNPSPDILRLSSIAFASQNPERFIKTYTFVADPAPHFQVSYDSNLIEALFKSAQLPLWGKNRPLCLVWLLLEGQTEGVISFESNPDWGVELDQLSRKWGLPLVMPLLDLEEVSQISVQDITMGNMSVLKQAAERYSADANVIVRLQEISPDAWSADWALLLDNEKITWQQRAPTEKILLAEGLQTLALHLQKRYASTSGQSEAVIQIEVNQVTHAQEYAKLLQYLKGLPFIAAVQVQSVQGSQVILQLTPKDSIASLEQTFASDGHLVKIQGSQYRWSGL